MFASQRIDAQAFDAELAILVGHKRVAGQGRVVHIFLVCVQRLGAEAEEAGVDAGEAGLSTCGRVARFCAAGSFGKVSGPFCPQAATANKAIRHTPTIHFEININQFYLP